MSVCVDYCSAVPDSSLPEIKYTALPVCGVALTMHTKILPERSTSSWVISKVIEITTNEMSLKLQTVGLLKLP